MRKNSQVPDGIRWTGHITGEYLTATGYAWLINQRLIYVPYGSSPSSNFFWIWQLKIPLKCVLLVWYVLPTSACRFRRGMVASAVCVLCNETVLISFKILLWLRGSGIAQAFPRQGLFSISRIAVLGCASCLLILIHWQQQLCGGFGVHVALYAWKTPK